ncbi:hypothetical protein FQA39_LY00645 [Lamprigera yunnana]|nr:hypothetical protein FQA39_LY00645 [Lamprigera yunnana]
MGANRWGNKVFVTVPRRRPGVPSTLNFIWMNSTERHNVPLLPYPNAEVNQLPSVDGEGILVSVYRTAVDSCNRLWMVDTGLLEYPGNTTRVHQSAVVVMDLITNQIIRRYELKESDMKTDTNLASIIIDVMPDSCDDAFAYMPDLGGFGLVVYSYREDTSWRISHNYFYVETLAGDFNIGGVKFQWNDGIFSVALSEFKPDGSRTAYFHSMAGTHLYSVSTNVLRNQTLATRSYHGDDFKVEVNRGQGTQASGSDLHKTSGLLFMGLVNQNALGCYNIFRPATPENFDVVHKDDQKFIYPCDVKISGDDIIVLTNAMPVFLYGRLNYDQVNFRIWINNVYEAVKGTKCINTSPTIMHRPPNRYRHY